MHHHRPFVTCCVDIRTICNRLEHVRHDITTISVYYQSSQPSSVYHQTSRVPAEGASVMLLLSLQCISRGYVPQ